MNKPTLIDCLVLGLMNAFATFGITPPERESSWSRGDEW